MVPCLGVIGNNNCDCACNEADFLAGGGVAVVHGCPLVFVASNDVFDDFGYSNPMKAAEALKYSLL